MNVVISGEINTGKSTVVDKIRRKNVCRIIRGFLTRPLFEDNQKKGYYIESFEGEREIFAHVDFIKRNKRGSMGIKQAIFNQFAVKILDQASEAELIIIDELGIMEKEATGFIEEVKNIFLWPLNVIAVIQKRALDFWISKIGKDNIDAIYIVDRKNRDYIPDRIANFLKNRSSGSPV